MVCGAGIALGVLSCSLGLDPNDIRDVAASGTVTSTGVVTSSATGDPGCGDGMCAAGETCASCPGDCPCGDGLGCGPAGACVPCLPTWGVAPKGAIASGKLALDGAGSLLCSGATLDPSPAMWVGRFNTCTGDMTGSGSVPSSDGAFTARATSITLGASTVILGGELLDKSSTSARGFFAGLDQKTLTPAWMATVDGSMASDEIWDIAGDDTAWLAVGGVDVQGPASGMWTVSGDGKGKTCGMTGPLASPTAFGRAVIPAPGGGYLMGVEDGTHTLIVEAPPECAVPMCKCDNAITLVVLDVGATLTDMRRMITIGNKLYVAGAASDAAADVYAFIAEIDLTSDLVLNLFKHQPTARIDGFTDIATDGEVLYLAAIQGWDGMTADFPMARGELLAVALPLVGDATMPVFDTVLPQGVYMGAAVQADEGKTGSVYVTGISATDSVKIFKCTKTGSCGQ